MKSGTTVLITTHYIEEAKSADNVGFISTGILLRQSNPYYLIQEYNCESLEDVFLLLCQNHYKRLREGRKVRTQVSEEVRVPPEPEEEILADIKPKRVSNKGIDSQRMGALLTKSYIRLKRNPFVTLMFFFLPLIIITIFKKTVGTSPRHIPMAIHTDQDLDTKFMAQRFLNEFLPDQIRYDIYPTEDEAINSVVKGKSMSALIFPANWSQSLLERMPSPFHVSEQVLNNSIVRIYVDHSNAIVAIFVRYTYIVDAIIRFLRKLIVDLDPDLNPSSISLPIDVSQQVFPGSFLESETYPSAGILVVVIYMMSISLSAMVIIKELKSKLLERIYVSGVKPIEVFFVHLIEMFALNAIQSLLVTLLMHYLFDIPINMTFFQSYSLILMHGIEGVGTGLFIALVFRDEIFAFVSILCNL